MGVDVDLSFELQEVPIEGHDYVTNLAAERSQSSLWGFGNKIHSDGAVSPL